MNLAAAELATVEICDLARETIYIPIDLSLTDAAWGTEIHPSPNENPIRVKTAIIAT
jgi:mannose-6-phosphate isomerase